MKGSFAITLFEQVPSSQYTTAGEASLIFTPGTNRMYIDVIRPGTTTLACQLSFEDWRRLINNLPAHPRGRKDEA